MSSLPARAPIIVLFRRDLRLADNGALAAAAQGGRPVVPLFILDETSPGVRAPGAASRWWLHRSLEVLDRSLEGLGARLVIRRGRVDEMVADAVRATGADTVFWNRRYDPAEAAVDASLKTRLRADGLTAESFDGALLHEPSRLRTGAGGFYKVYTPFWRALEAEGEPRDPIDAPDRLAGFAGRLASERLGDLALLPKKPDWSGGLAERWTPGEAGAQERLQDFVADDVATYDDRRDRPAEAGTSRLSPHLAHGEITPAQIFSALRQARGDGITKYRKEIGWREFCYHLLFHNPDLATRNFRPEFDGIDWRDDASGLEAWRRGRTGYPIVDAGMRELWHTGWMHNRVRMIAASFLSKDLLVDWRLGEQWFWDTLVDADAANNAAGWQWVAGTGADAAPYFRVFNPVLQGERFDAKGSYVRRWVPELARLPDAHIHRPWEAPERALAEAGVRLGETYPRPMVDHAQARDRALAAFAAGRDGGGR